MSYSEENGQVTLTMSRTQYDQLLEVFAAATVRCFPETMWILRLLNSLNEGNPNYAAYKLVEVTDKASAPPDSLPHRPAK